MPSSNEAGRCQQSAKQWITPDTWEYSDWKKGAVDTGFPLFFVIESL